MCSLCAVDGDGFMENTRRQTGKNRLISIRCREIHLRHQSGFSLVEWIVYLGLLLTLMVLIAPILHTFFSPVDISSMRLDREAQIFFQQFEREIHAGNAYQVNDRQTGQERVQAGDQLVVTIEGDTYTYEQHDSVVRRRLNDEGHIVLAQFVRHVQFQAVHAQAIKVTLHLHKDGQTYATERLVSLKAGRSRDFNQNVRKTENRVEEEDEEQENER